MSVLPSASRLPSNRLIACDADTEIDWKTYMQQVSLYVKGERDYAAITGDTGPLVYPGLHVYIYRLLYAVTDQGASILTGQAIFAGLYLATLWVVMECYKNAKVWIPRRAKAPFDDDRPPSLYSRC
jgi:hypothetical protein